MGEPVTLRGTTARSSLGNLFGVFAVVWMIGGLILVEYITTLFVPRELRPRWLSYLLIAQALLPGFIVLAAGALGRHRPFRWLLAWPQPSVTIDDPGMELCLPGRGCERFRWEEIGRLVPAPFTRRDRWAWLVSSGRPHLELRAPDGRILAMLPHALALPHHGPQTGGPLSHRKTMAEVVVAHRPNRFGLLRPPGKLGALLSFALLGDASPAWEIEAAARRNRMAVALYVGGLVAAAAVGFIVVYVIR